jgi:hypothetical protein
MSLNEILLQLEAEKLKFNKLDQGPSVAAMTKDHALELNEVRALLDEYAVQLLTQDASDVLVRSRGDEVGKTAFGRNAPRPQIPDSSEKAFLLRHSYQRRQ